MKRRANAPKRERREAIERFMVLRPLVLARMDDSIPSELRDEFESVTVHQLKALVRLPAGGLTMHELASALGVSGATASALADRLVARGFVARTTDDKDRRVVRLVLSPEGAALAERWRSARREAIEELFSALSDSQVVAWLDIMETLAADQPAYEPPGAGIARLVDAGR